MNIKRHIFEFILDNHSRWNCVPTRSEVHRMFAGRSNDLDLHLEQLEHEGLLKLGRDGGDTISLVPTFPCARQIGLQGKPAKRLPHGPTDYAPGCVALDLRGVGITMEDDLFALLVADDSMIDAGLRRHDIAVLKPGGPARGEVVAVKVAGELALRRYIVVLGIPHLLAENPLRPELTPAHEHTFHGVLWGLIRTEPSGRTCRVAPTKISYSESVTLSPEEKFARKAESYLPPKQKKTDRSLALAGSTEVPRVVKKRPNRQRQAKKEWHDWPKPPSGVALNDESTAHYRVLSEGLICDEQPDGKYHQAYIDAFAKSARQCKEARDKSSAP